MFTDIEDPIVSMGIGHKISKGETCKFVKNKLATNKAWATNALVKIFEFQTETEKTCEHTYENNNVGFTGVDGEILTSFAKQFISRNFLSEKQMKLLYKKMPKYWMQVIKISNPEKLEKMIRKSLLAA